MTVTYETEFAAVCPVDGTRDIYRLTVITRSDWIPVESILAAIEEATDEPRYQEEITERLSDRLGEATVQTTGVHSGVATTARVDGAIADPRA